MTQPAHLPESAKHLKAARDALWERAEAGAVGGFAWEYTHLVDRYFEERIIETDSQSFAFTLVAVGGYGRGRLCPGSDIDILLICRRRIPKAAEQFTKDLLFPLWDLGFDLGHGVRTVSDCVSLAAKDYQVFASLLDARPLAGDAEVFHFFQNTFEKKVLRKKGKAFADSLHAHNTTRARQYGDASAMLEPELKNGLGGLRDGQQVFWLNSLMKTTKAPPVFLPEELARLREDQAFLNRVRTALHLAAGRKTDRLFFDLQPQTARLMGFANQGDSPKDTGRGVEFFLSRLHQAMTRIKSMREALFQERFSPPRTTASAPEAPNIAACPEGLFFEAHTNATPDDVLDAFRESARTGLPLTWNARRIIRDNPGRFASRLIDRPETLTALVEIFLSAHADTACDGLLETRLLPAIFPEFGDVEHLIQFNDYHVHPVGRHTLATVTQLSSFLRDTGHWTGETASRISSPTNLILAGFFHDLGKGEPNHSRTGAEITHDILSRFSMSKPDIEEIAFLVRHHLLIPKTATRRDLSDERVVSELATTAGSTKRLDMLYLLSIADSMATGPRAWNAWTRSLFEETYHKAINLLEHGHLSKPDSAQRLVSARNEVIEACPDMDTNHVVAALGAMPPRAFLALDTNTLARHIKMANTLWQKIAEDRIRKPSTIGGKSVCVLEAESGKVEGTFRLTIAALDRTGLFATIAGAISLHGMNILSAELFTWSDGTAIDVITVSAPPDNLFAKEVWARVNRSIGYALTGKLDIAARLDQQRQSPLGKSRTGPKLCPMVTIDNQGSDFYTIIEVAATDRTGLLFDMAETLSANGISIHLAKITTIKGRAADIFHVRSATGLKIMEKERIALLRESLLEAAGIS